MFNQTAIQFPIYFQISELLNENSDLAYKINQEDLKPVMQLSASKPGLLNTETLKKVSEIYNLQERSLCELIEKLNKNYKLASDLETIQLKKILLFCDNAYYNADDESLNLNSKMLTNEVYDYVKRIHGQRTTGSMDKDLTMLSVSSKTGVGVKPTRARDAKLPISLRSLDNLYMNEGDVEKWANSKEKGSYCISAKMDGTSALYYQNILYTRGDSNTGRNISHVLKFLNLPTVNYAVRGEMVISQTVFNEKYKDKPCFSQSSVRKINRNSVSGAIGSINHIDEEFLSDLTFVAYEIILNPENLKMVQLSPSEQFETLKSDGFTVAYNKTILEISDNILSKEYHYLIDNYNYVVDGVVIKINKKYIRETSKNPEDAKAFKEALENDVAVTKVIDIEWNVSQYGYLIPTIIYEPVEISGVKLQRATAHNAREVQKLKIGPGAVIEIVYRAKVNPQVNRVLTPVEPSMPKIPFKWLKNGLNEPVNIIYNDKDKEIVIDDDNDKDSKDKDDKDADANDKVESLSLNVKDTITIKKIHKFLIEIEAKGIGETTVEKIFHKTSIKNINDFINLKQEDILFLGKLASLNVVSSIQTAMSKINLATLMAGSKLFGRGLGSKKFSKILTQYEDFAEKRHSYEEYVKMFIAVDGFADKTAKLAAEGMLHFWEFIDNELSPEIYAKILKTTKIVSPVLNHGNNFNFKLENKNIYITGTRDAKLIELIKLHKGTIQTTFNASTHILVKKDDDYTNNKTEEAFKKGITIFTVETFTKILS